MLVKIFAPVLCLGGLVAIPAARADTDSTYTPPATTTTTTTTSTGDTYTSVDETPGIYSYAWREPGMQSGIGVGIVAGGGIGGFSDKTMRDSLNSNVTGLWDVRATIGTHIPLGIDLAYVGTAANINTLSGAPNGTLVGTEFEAALRYNILPHAPFDPYVFAGAGWQHFNITSQNLPQADSGMKSSDDVLVIPMGAGLGYRDPTGLTVDVHGTFRAATNSDLVLNTNTNHFADVHTWEASAAIGYEF